jgi:hypothetical protein
MDKKLDYRTSSLLTVPIMEQSRGIVIAVIQVLRAVSRECQATSSPECWTGG